MNVGRRDPQNLAPRLELNVNVRHRMRVPIRDRSGAFEHRSTHAKRRVAASGRDHEENTDTGRVDAKGSKPRAVASSYRTSIVIA